MVTKNSSTNIQFFAIFWDLDQPSSDSYDDYRLEERASEKHTLNTKC